MATWVVVLRLLAVLIGIRGLTNFAKPFGFGTAFVFFGTMVTGTAGHVLAVLFGVLLVVYAWGAWHLRRFATPMAIVYSIFVALNVPLFVIVNHIPNEPRVWVGGIVFLLIAVGVTAGSAYLLYVHRNELR
jgi:hypothetical protein